MYTEIRWQQRFQHFEKAFLHLQNAMNRKEEIAKDPLLESGTIQVYEFCTELAWKTMKDFLEEKSIIISNPKDVIREALKQGYIENAEAWMKILQDRNLTSHAYDGEIAKTVIYNIEVLHFSVLQDLYHFFQSHYAE